MSKEAENYANFKARAELDADQYSALAAVMLEYAERNPGSEIAKTLRTIKFTRTQ